MKTKTYTKHKKTAKNDEWDKSGLNCTMPVKSVRLKKESQLDRIERKLDELLKRQPTINITPRPGEWHVPYQVNTTTPSPTEQHRYPTDTFGQPVPYAVSMGGTR